MKLPMCNINSTCRGTLLRPHHITIHPLYPRQPAVWGGSPRPGQHFFHICFASQAFLQTLWLHSELPFLSPSSSTRLDSPFAVVTTQHPPGSLFKPAPRLSQGWGKIPAAETSTKYSNALVFLARGASTAIVQDSGLCCLTPPGARSTARASDPSRSSAIILPSRLLWLAVQIKVQRSIILHMIVRQPWLRPHHHQTGVEIATPPLGTWRSGASQTYDHEICSPATDS